MGDIDRLSRNYAFGSAAIFCVLFPVGVLLMNICDIPGMMAPLIVSAVFMLVVDMADVAVWRLIAKRAPSYLPTFYTSVSAFRMLLALAVMFVYYLIAGRGAMLIFFLTFMVFYLASLIHHAVFFAKVSNKS